MKKIFAIITATALSAGLISAQDMKKATELAQTANAALEEQNFEVALSGFREALAEAEKCGVEGLELVSTCQSVIPGILYSIGNEFLGMKEYDLAISSFNDAVSEGKKFENQEIIDKANGKIAVIYLQKGASALTAKNFDEALDNFQKSIALDSTSGAAYLRLGQTYMQKGDYAEAEKALAKASVNGQEEQAGKMLKNMGLIKMNKAYQAKDYAGTVNAAYDYIQAYGPDEKAYQFAILSSLSGNKTADAAKFLDEFNQAFPDSPKATEYAYRIAVGYQKAGNNAKAKEYYQMAVNDPKFGASAKEQIAALQ